MIHKVRQPFMARAGQFAPGSVPAVGILVSVLLKKKDLYQFKIGDNPKLYQAKAIDVLTYARDKGSIWINRKQKPVAVVPIFLFEGRIPADPKQPELFRADIDG